LHPAADVADEGSGGHRREHPVMERRPRRARARSSFLGRMPLGGFAYRFGHRCLRVRGRWRCSVDIERQLVRVAPPPILAGFVRTDHRMVVVRSPVSRRVPVRRRVTATNVPAVHAQTQVQPSPPNAEAVLATVTRRHHVCVDRPEVSASFHCIPFTGRQRPTASCSSRRPSPSRQDKDISSSHDGRKMKS
jgi:hypothetical protein